MDDHDEQTVFAVGKHVITELGYACEEEGICVRCMKAYVALQLLADVADVSNQDYMATLMPTVAVAMGFRAEPMASETIH